MKKLILIAQTSMDGFVAGPKGEFDNFTGDDENLAFVCSLTDDADTALFGRISYQLLDKHWPTAGSRPDATGSMIKYSNWYNRANKFFISKTLRSGNSENTKVISEDIADDINKIKQTGNTGNKNILMFGGPTAVHTLLELQLLDEIWFLIHPVLFGEGIPLFRNRKKVTGLSLLTTKHFSNGTIGLHYSLNKN